MKDKKILITGGTGFIGSWLAEMLYKKNKVTLFDNGRRNALQYVSTDVRDNVELITGDIRNMNNVERVTKNQDIIFHLAAIAGASSYEKDPLLTLHVNLFGTENILKSVVNTSLQHMIIFSSSEVYGAHAHGVSEHDSTTIGPVYEGRWSYAISKLASDHVAFAYYKKHNVPITIVRPFNVYGPRQIGEGAIVNMMKTLIVENTVYVSGDGSQKRAWCYITDFLDAINRVLRKKAIGECFNIGNPSAYCSMSDMAALISGFSDNTSVTFMKGNTTEIQDRLPDIKKAEKELGFRPKVGLPEGLLKSFAWYKTYAQNIG